jgi:hypothetical protein
MRIAKAAIVFVGLLVAYSAIGAAQNRDVQKKLQREVASKTATFGRISKSDHVYQKARDAHDLDGAHKFLGQPGAFKGTVTQIFEERDGDLLILDFDKNYRTAMTAILRNADFSKFPDMQMLQDKELVISGKFTEYQGRAQVELSDPAQIKLVQ